MVKILLKRVLPSVIVLAVAAAQARSFTHQMPESTGEKPTNPAYAEMARDFADPFGKVRTGCYWYWMAGNVSCEGVRKDLEAMKRAGIDRAYIGDIGGGGNKPGPVKTFSPEWEKALATACETASRLDIEIGIFNSPGWSQSGGPWVKPEAAMRLGSRIDWKQRTSMIPCFSARGSRLSWSLNPRRRLRRSPPSLPSLTVPLREE